MSKGRKKYLLLKTDIEKAFDKVSWDAILTVMTCMNYPPTFIVWIESCIKSPRFSCIINGTPFNLFRSNCGIHQGDPISPYLFHFIAGVLFPNQ